MNTRKKRLPIGSTFTYTGSPLTYNVAGQVVTLRPGMIGTITGRKSFQENGTRYMDYDVEFPNGVATTFVDFVVEPNAL